MIQSCHELDEYDRQRIAGVRPDYQRNLKIFQSLYDYACAVGAFPLADPLAGVDVDIHLAKVLHAKLAKPHNPSG